MSSVYKRGKEKRKKDSCYTYKYKDQYGKWKTGKGWPDYQKTKHHADTLEAEHRAVRNGEKTAPPAWQKRSRQPIQEIIVEYLKWGNMHGGKKNRPWAKQLSENKPRQLKYWTEALGVNTLSEIQLSDVDRCALELKEKNLTGKTVNHYVGALKAFLNWAVKRGFLESNPIKHASRFSDERTWSHRRLTEEEIQRLERAAPPARKLIYKTALATGYRQDELRSLKVSDLDMFNKTLNLSGKFTKNRKDASQPISDDLAKELSEFSKGQVLSSPLLRVPTRSSASDNIARDFKNARIIRLAKDGKGKATFHSFRATYISMLVETKMDLKTIMELSRLGSSQLVLETYAKAMPERVRAGGNLIGDKIDDMLKVVSL